MIARQDGFHDPHAGVDEAGPAVGAGDGKTGNPHGTALSDVAVAEVEPEQVCVRDFVELAPVAPWTQGAASAWALATLRAVHMLPVADRAEWNARHPGDSRVLRAATQKGECLLARSRVVHAVERDRFAPVAVCGWVEFAREGDDYSLPGYLRIEGKVPRVGLEPTLCGF
ncbi:hypothetical protein GCM10010282_07560 [Streptomyces roseolus]|nr:hypothetical protein GCM10010282_07560 [Streptomyces roseolus]